MPRRTAVSDDGDDEGDGFEYDDEPALVPCPYCRREIVENAERCPYCETYISAEDAPASRKPWWIIVGTLLCLWVVYRWVAG